MFRYSEHSKSFGDVITEAFIMGFSHYKALIPLLPLNFAGVFLVSDAQQQFIRVMQDDGEMGLAVGMLAVGMIIMTLSLLAMFRQGHGLASGEDIGTSESLSIAGRFLLVAVLCMIGYMALVVLGLMLFVIPGIIVGVSMSLFLPLIVNENAGFDCLRRSHDLVWGNWWWMVGVLLTMAVIGMLFMFGAMTVLAIFVDLPPQFGTGGLPPIEEIRKVTIASSIISCLLVPIQIGLQLVLVHELKLRKGPPDDIDSFKGIAA
jgi:hypothetical protein